MSRRNANFKSIQRVLCVSVNVYVNFYVYVYVCLCPCVCSRSRFACDFRGQVARPMMNVALRDLPPRDSPPRLTWRPESAPVNSRPLRRPLRSAIIRHRRRSDCGDKRRRRTIIIVHLLLRAFAGWHAKRASRPDDDSLGTGAFIWRPQAFGSQAAQRFARELTSVAVGANLPSEQLTCPCRDVGSASSRSILSGR